MEVIVIEYLTQRVHLKHLSASDIQQLTTLAFLARKHYNYILDTLDCYYSETGHVAALKYLLNCEKQSDSFLGSQFYIASLARKNYLKTAYSHSCSPGRYDSPLSVPFKGSYREGRLHIPASRFTRELSAPLELTREPQRIKVVNLIPVRGSLDYWEVAIQYEVNSPELTIQAPICEFTCAAIDLGVENFVTIATTDLSAGSLIVDGRRLKSIIYTYMKSQKTEKEKIRHRNKIIDYVNKSVQIVVDYCLKNHVKVVVLGEGLVNAAQRLESKNYFLSQFPFSELRSNLILKLNLNGIVVQEIPEAFTSLASFLDGDYMPRNALNTRFQFSGKRVHRGLYISKEGYKLNADVNACYNLLAKTNLFDLNYLRKNPEILQKLSPIRVDPLNP